MIALLVLKCIVIAVVTTSTFAEHFNLDVDQLWNVYKVTFNKYYTDNEEPIRRETFVHNIDYILKHNLEADMGMHNYRMRVNAICDSTNEQVTSLLNGYKGPMGLAVNDEGERELPELPDEPLPLSLDWREHGLVTEVKDQGACGSCYTFATTGSIEGQIAKATGKLVSLSEQNILDCSKETGNAGCMGGWMGFAYQYIWQNGGINSESAYPYEAFENACRFNKSGVEATVKGYVQLPAGDEKALQYATFKNGPIAIALDASLKSFQFYGDGVYDQVGCSSSELDHAVLLVGYGSENGQDYWLVKNSWGRSWGMDGYIKIARNRKNHCGVATAAIFPLV